MSSEIAKAYVQIMPSMQGIKGKLKAAMNDEAVSAGTSSGKTLGSSIASSLKSAAGTIAKAATAAVGAGTAAATALVKDAAGYYADYEQLAGGVETLFGSSANTIKGYALEAYQTAGLTANEYMETTTSFAASLLQGLSGDTATAAEYANTAVTDMADNANKMGSSMESIQNAYQGFAKQNYTMLDNLKLGYGGTASEMARLINDSGVLGDKVKVTSDTINDVSFAKIIEAIHTVQDNMGITGTTALEASETISGSVATMKSSWKNLVGAMANGDADIGYFVDNFVESAETATSNVLPAIETAIGGIGTLVQELGPKITAALPELLTTVLPGMVSAGISMLGAVGEGIAAAVPELVSIAGDAVLGAAEDIFGVEAVETATSSISTAIDTVKTKFSEVTEAMQPLADAISGEFEKVKEAVQPLVDAISDYVTSGELMNDVTSTLEGVMETAKTAIGRLTDNIEILTPIVGAAVAGFVTFKTALGISSLIQSAKSAFTGLKTAVLAVNAAMAANPFALVAAVIAAIIGTVVTLWNTNDGFREAIISAWETIKEKVGGAVDAMAGFFSSIGETASSIWTSICEAVSTAWETIKETVSTALDTIGEAISSAWNAISGTITAVLDGIKTTVSGAWNSVKSCVSGAVNAVKDTVTTGFNAAKETASTIWETMKLGIQTILDAIKDTVGDIFGGIKTTISDKLTAAKETVTDIFDNIKSAISDKIEGAKDTVKNAIDKIKSFFNFEWSLPSLKLPHISISGGFSLNPPSVPSFGISWYAKAMDNPMLLNGATIFGAMGGNFLGGGEAGTEVVSGADTLMNMIRNAVTDTLYEGGVSGLEERIDRVLALLERYFPEFASADVVLSTGQLVGAIVTEIDRQLGIINKRRNRE